jgi:hypothetical protein
MHIARRIVAGAGALMVSALLTLVSMTGTQWVKDHPRGVLALGLALLLGAVACLVFWSLTNEKKPAHLTNEGAFAARDNKGTQISGSIIGDDALEKILKASLQAKAPSRLHIQSAEYVSIDDPTKFVHVTECLRQLIDDDQLVFEIQNHNFVANGRNYVPRDIHTGHRKKLCVAYSFNNGPLQVMAELEGAILRLPQSETSNLPKKSLPVLDLAFSEGDLEVSDTGTAFTNVGGEKCYSIRVHNRRAAARQVAHRADSLSAGLTFKFSGSS